MFEEKVLTTYAAWLGKLIGIRLGAPVESWSHKEIMDTYVKIKGYPVDYGQFASDDDANGPLFFVRSLQDHPSSDITTEEMGDGLLGYAPDGHSFFWWGGIGVSTEDTSYHNLLKGIRSPKSGSAEVNGKGLSEQIGGQIFSDCWGYVSLGNADLAVNLAEKMSHVTHDGQAVEGGKFVAACIALAYNIKDTGSIIDKALGYLGEGEYKECVLDIVDKHETLNENECLEYILENYAYCNYPGVCHVIPNTAIMIWAMLYGNNDFDKTLCMLCEAGWDTDCTCGNVGSIMGAMVGLEGIDPKWIEPFKDILISSGVIGGYNIDTISNTARFYSLLGAELNHIEVPSGFTYTLENPDYMFDLPYGTQGFQVESDRYHEARLYTKDNKLNVGIGIFFANHPMKIYKKTYFDPDEVYDCRYQPDMAATLYPGNTITYSLRSDVPVMVKEYVVDMNGKTYYGDEYVVDKAFKSHVFKLNYIKEGYYKEFGFEVVTKERCGRFVMEFDKVSIDHKMDTVLDFTKMEMEDWGEEYGGNIWKTIPCCTTFRANAYLDHGLHIKNDGVITGDPYAFLRELDLEGEWNGTLDVRFNLHSLVHYWSLEISDQFIKLADYYHHEVKNALILPCFIEKNAKKQLNIIFKNDLIIVYFNGTKYEFSAIGYRCDQGSIGFFNLEDSDDCIRHCHIICDE